MPFNPRVFFRKSHRWGAVVVAAPFLLVLVTGLLLQVKKQVPWVQPGTKKGSAKVPEASFDAILTAVRGVPEAGVSGWDDIERLDIRPRDGVAKVLCKSRYEVQVDFRTGEVVQVAYRRSDLIESLHDGSWFGDGAKLYAFLPAAVIVLGLWVTGMYLFVLPYSSRLRRKHPSSNPGRPAPRVVSAAPGSSLSPLLPLTLSPSLSASARRFLVVQALMLWQGGFLFYTSVVVPAGTHVLGSAAAQGAITTRVTDLLNVLGIVGLAVTCWDLALTRDPNRGRTAARWWSWAVALVCQGLLVYFHLLLDAFMDPGRSYIVIRPPFYPVHRMYLWASTIQWLACLLLAWWTLRAWAAEERARL